MDQRQKAASSSSCSPSRVFSLDSRGYSHFRRNARRRIDRSISARSTPRLARQSDGTITGSVFTWPCRRTTSPWLALIIARRALRDSVDPERIANLLALVSPERARAPISRERPRTRNSPCATNCTPTPRRHLARRSDIAEIDSQRHFCVRLSGHLSRSRVIHGAGTRERN